VSLSAEVLERGLSVQSGAVKVEMAVTIESTYDRRTGGGRMDSSLQFLNLPEREMVKCFHGREVVALKRNEYQRAFQ
jgi:hypothetical protein